ncbi:putative Lipase (class 3) [Trypanosoma vivax]|uniref:Fungal lipase-type domain-containing protein n=1 Tax=Trypanosoma vivax (strain Y486) TaxID=1055687 RepID=G0U3M0_TRYVY|nr:hypothetical protein TRVL_05727 [Trypanosoma vivax]KAH8614249.1 putative Lipase (class 3) [Trypanosoma vivax]CCC50877.1 conserved hypothetical protein [Trypanosoma vivax Y486]
MRGLRVARQETFAVYRALVRAVWQVTRDCPLYRTDGLARYVAARFLDKAERNRQHYLRLFSKLADTPQQRQRQRMQRSLETQYEQFIKRELQQVRGVTELLKLAPGNSVLTSMLQVLSAGVGNIYYQQTMERGYIHYCQFEERKVERDEVEEEATSDRQNRIMQHALIPYGERLLFLHRLQPMNGDNKMTQRTRDTWTPWQVTEAVAGSRSGVTAHHMSHGREDVVLEVDETYNKQVVYVRCEPYDWSQDVERVEIMESEELRGTIFHGGYFGIAQRLCDALLVETPLHRYRSTVVVGYGVGGAVAFCLSLLLHARSFDVKNCVTFGSPKAVQQTLRRYTHAVNPIRVVLEGDPLIELPVTGAEGDVFRHFGELLILGPSNHQHQQRQARGAVCTEESLNAEMLSESLDSGVHTVTDGDEGGAGVLPERVQRATERHSTLFSVERYVEHLTDTTVPLTYAEGDEVWDEGDYSQMRRDASLRAHT